MSDFSVNEAEERRIKIKTHKILFYEFFRHFLFRIKILNLIFALSQEPCR